MTYEQSHTIGRRVKPTRKKKKKDGIEETQDTAPPNRAIVGNDFLPLTDHKSSRANPRKAPTPENDAASTMEDRLRSPTSST